MRLAVVVVALAGCKDGRVAELEARMQTLEEKVAAYERVHSSNTTTMLASMSTLQDGYLDRFRSLGLTDKNNQTVASWWCFDSGGMCVRRKAECDEMQRLGNPTATCIGRRVAFCEEGTGAGSPCVTDLERCSRMTKRRCIGVE